MLGRYAEVEGEDDLVGLEGVGDALFDDVHVDDEVTAGVSRLYTLIRSRPPQNSLDPRHFVLHSDGFAATVPGLMVLLMKHSLK